MLNISLFLMNWVGRILWLIKMVKIYTLGHFLHRPNLDGIEYVIYSEKSVAVAADMKRLGGMSNQNLTIHGVKKAGWIFANGKQPRLTEFLGKEPLI